MEKPQLIKFKCKYGFCEIFWMFKSLGFLTGAISGTYPHSIQLDKRKQPPFEDALLGLLHHSTERDSVFHFYLLFSLPLFFLEQRLWLLRRGVIVPKTVSFGIMALCFRNPTYLFALKMSQGSIFFTTLFSCKFSCKSKQSQTTLPVFSHQQSTCLPSGVQDWPYTNSVYLLTYQKWNPPPHMSHT